MNQIEVVWHNAYLPLNYDKHNCVVLRVELEDHCRGAVGYLAENSELEVLVEQTDIVGNKPEQ